MEKNLNPSVGIVLTSRVKSRRLPGKALRKIGNKTLCQITLENLLRQKTYPVVLAIPASEDDDELEQIGLDMGVRVYRGEDDSPLHRLHAVAQQFGFDHVVRITQDDILIDFILLQNQVRHHLGAKFGANDYTKMIKCPEGTAGEVISANALSKAVKEVGNKPVEDVSYYVRRPEKFKCGEYYPSPAHQYQFRLTIDYEEDLRLMRILFAMLPSPFESLDAIHLLRNRNTRDLLDINRLPAVTVYTCCYNQSAYLDECLKSVEKQSWSDFELIIVDDASMDETPAVILDWYSGLSDEFKKRVRIIRNEKNLGLSASSNKAIGMAKGKYIVRVDSDDILQSEFVYQMKVHLDENGDQAAVFAPYEEFGLSSLIGTGQDRYNHSACAMIRTGAIKEVMYKEGLNNYEGLEFWKRFKEYFKHGFVDHEGPLWYYRKHEKAKSAQKTKEREADLASIANG